MTALLLRQIVRRCGSFTLIIPHLEVPRGAIFGIMGPNGAGKTTLLSLMGLLDLPEEGEMTLFGEKVSANKKKRLVQRRRIGFLTQETVLFPSRSVEENIAYGLQVRNFSSDEIRNAVGSVAEMLHLSPVMKKRTVEGLSGGEARRVAFARVMVLPADLYLLDEPLAGVDRESGDLIAAAVASLSSAGKTVGIVSHGEDRIVTLFTNGIVLEGGAIREQFSKGETL